LLLIETMVIQFILVLLAAIPLVPILGGYLLRLVLRAGGDHLRRKTSARRDLILQRVKVEEVQLQKVSKPSPRIEDEDWEKVESHSTGTAPNGDVPKERDYYGVIGFFHPFW
jgi:alpha-1,2-mannosyltransferase